MELATQYEKLLSDWVIDGHTQTNNWHGGSFQISNLIWLWENTLLPGEKPHIQGNNMKAPHGKHVNKCRNEQLWLNLN